MFWKFVNQLILATFLFIRTGITQEVSYTCPSGWTIKNNQCYLFVGESKKHSQAQDACRTLGGDLLSIWTMPEMYFVKDFIRVRIASPNLLGWTALKRVGQDWEWVDGSLQQYILWHLQPKSTYNKEMCGAVVGGNSKFYPLSCNQLASVFICKRGAVAAYELGVPWQSNPAVVNSTGTSNGRQAMFHLSNNVDDIIGRLNTTETHNARNEADCGLMCMRTQGCSGFVYQCRQTTGCEKYDCVMAYS